MDHLSYKTLFASKKEVESKWLVIDASNQPLGRLASQVAALLRGKHKACYTPNTLCGDRVIVINSAKIKLTGNKWDNKIITSHSGYPGGQKNIPSRKVHEKNPAKLVELAVKGMLPKNRLGSRMFAALHVYGGSEHPHTAQNPETFELKN